MPVTKKKLFVFTTVLILPRSRDFVNWFTVQDRELLYWFQSFKHINLSYNQVTLYYHYNAFSTSWKLEAKIMTTRLTGGLSQGYKPTSPASA